MRQVVSSIKTVQKILGRQKVEEGIPYRLSAHCMRVERPEGVLLYHNLIGELLLLSAEEAAAPGGLPGPLPPESGEPAARRFLRPLEADDTAVADQIREIAGVRVNVRLNMDGSVCGSIYSDKVDEKVLRQWKKQKPPEAACRACTIYPQCVRSKKCPYRPENCTPIKRAYREEKILCGITGDYEEWKAGRPAPADTE